MEIKYINSNNWRNFLLNQIEKYNVFSLFKQGDAGYDYLRLSAENLKDTVIGKYRSIVPVKTFFFPPTEKIVPTETIKPQIIVGVKACELAHLRILDAMFSGNEVIDPGYSEARKKTVIISSDCTEALDCCFCSIIEGSPYPTYGFDINLRPVKNGFVVEILSEKGKALIENDGSLFQNAVSNHLDESDKNRVEVNESVLKVNKKYILAKELSETVKLSRTDLWKEISKECVECGGCRFICSTCYCFLIGEEKNFEKFRLWDACQFKGYARVAGGANPRPTKEKRYKNLYLCKMDYRRQNFGFYACTGCGKCIEVCPAEIDIREILTRIGNTEQTKK